MKQIPSIEAWLKDAKKEANAKNVGMYLIHNGVVRESSKAKVRYNDENAKPVIGMKFSYDNQKLQNAIQKAYTMPGIAYINVWLNEGILQVGEDIMYVLIGGDIRPHVVDCLETLVGTIKHECVIEEEIYE